MAPTIRDVAREAAVSASTVSRALSAPGLVNADTRARVEEVARRLGYQPNRAARGLITGRVGNLGVVVPDLANPFFATLVKGVQARASAADYAVFVADSDEDPVAEAALVKRLARQVDGLVICSPRMPAARIRESAAELPCVVVHRVVDDLPAVLFDLADAMGDVVAHLAALGHRRVAYVAGPKDSWSDGERRRGLHAAAEAAGVDLVEVGHVAPQVVGGLAVADRVLASGATAVVACNDVVALGLLHRFAARGVAVPADISVVGCDDVPMAALATPALTTVAVPTQRAGRAAVDLLLELLGGGAGSTFRLPTQLVVRASTGMAVS